MTQALPEHVCKSCGNQFRGYYCNLCGEKIIEPQDRSFKAFLSNILVAVTFADNRVIKTLWLVILKPGFISREFSEGRRIHYLKPLSLFFVLNLFYFLFPVIQLFNASLTTQLLAPFGRLFEDIIAFKMVDMNIRNLAGFSLVYNQKSTSLAKLFVMVFVIISSLPLNFLYRNKNRYFSDHLGYMVELACFNLFINAILLTALTRLLGLGHYVNELTLTFFFITTNLWFLLRSANIFYGQKGWKLIVKSLLMLLFLKISLELYRAVLFFVTIASL
jgi:Protein of unknown function (DUF3667)